MGFLGGPDQPLKLPEEAEIPPLLQETQNHLEFPRKLNLFCLRWRPRPSLQSPLKRQKHLQFSRRLHLHLQRSLRKLEILYIHRAPAEPSSTPEEVESSSVQQEASAKPTEAPEEVEPWTPQEAPAQHPEPSEVVPQPIAHEVNVPSRNQNEAQQPGFRNVTVKPADLALTVTLAQPPERPEESEPSPIQQEAPVQPAERPEEAGPTPVQPEPPTQSAERPEESRPTPVQPEVPAQPAEHPRRPGPPQSTWRSWLSQQSVPRRPGPPQSSRRP